MFSRRSTFEQAGTLLEQAIADARASGRQLIDLTVSNPLACGLGPEANATVLPLANVAAMQYQPHPRGLHTSREAVSEYYAGRVSPEQVVLTASTSEAYSMLFRLLCDPGDEVLIPQPGYPLFDLLAAFDNVALQSYPLRYDHGWQIDFHALEQAITPLTRAIVVVHPNNPTGHFTGGAERELLDELAAKYGLALIVDEVFLDYPVEAPLPQQSFAASPSRPLTFTLSGLSKVCALPQMKVAWACVTGPDGLVCAALERMDLFTDSFLSVATPAQLALPAWLAARSETQAGVLQRVLTNLDRMDKTIDGSALTRLRVEGGWAAVLRVPATLPADEVAACLIQDASVIVHPGSFYGFPKTGWLVISLLPRVDEFAMGIAQVVSGIERVNAG